MVVKIANFKKWSASTLLSEEQLQQFISAIEQDGIWRDLFYTEIKTGLRRGEICGLKWTDFNEDEGSLRIDRSVSDGKKGSITIGETKTGKSCFTSLYLFFLSAVISFQLGSSLSPIIMTGGTFHQLSTIAPWRKVCFFAALSASDFVKQTALAAFGSVSLFGFKKSCFPQIP